MAYVFLDDGSPEASEYDSNYFCFDESDSSAYSSIQSLLSRTGPKDPTVRMKLQNICQSSLNRRRVGKAEKTGTGWFGGITKFVYHLLF